jgi:uncharacterized protein YkwD
MLHWLQEHFLPHEGNDHQPHFLRSENIQTLLIILLITQALFLIIAFVVVPQSKQVAAVIASALVEQTNTERTKAKAGALTQNEKLKLSAQLKANDMAEKGYFAHDAPDGTPPWYWIRKAGYEYQYAGENLAVNFVESKDVTSAWMNSPTHRENLLSGKYSEVGIATAIGKYKGRDAIFVVQHFGKPMQAFSLTNIGVNTRQSNGTAVPPTNVSNVLGATNEHVVSIWAKVMSMPRSLALAIEVAIGLLVFTALVLAIFVRIHVQHPLILANGVILMSLSAGLAFMNAIISQGTI